MDLQKEYKLTYIFVTHDLSVVRHISTHICVMYLGQMVETSDTDELFLHPYHPYTKDVYKRQIQNHGNLLFVNHHIGNLKHGRQVILKINHVAMATRKRHKRKITGIRQFLQDTAYSGFGESPPGAQFTVSHQRIARTVAQIDDRSYFRALHLRICLLYTSRCV